MIPGMSYSQLQQWVWRVVEPDRLGDVHSRLFDIVIILLILLNVAAVILESVYWIRVRWGVGLRLFEHLSVAVFTVEYLLRIWSVTADPRYRAPVAGRLRFAVRPLPLIDLLAILPHYLSLFGVDLRILRALRVIRLLRIAKLARYYEAFRLISRVIRLQKEKLVLTMSVLSVLLIISSALMYAVEGSAQPESFPDIPTTMWWSIVTLTTVGYGDVYPITGAGRLLAAVISVFGIGMVALPAGIIGSGFVEEMAHGSEAEVRCCPHCGKPISPDQDAGGSHD